MARSGKSKKATDNEKQSVEKPKDAEKTISEIETDLENSDEIAESLKDSDALEASLADAQAEPEHGEEPELTEREALESAVEDDTIESIEDAEAETEQGLYGEADADDIVTRDETSDPELEDLQDDISASKADVLNEQAELDADHKDADPQDETSDVEKQEDVTQEPEPAESRPEPVPVPQAAGSSMWPGVFGGVIAALIGFVVGRGDIIDAYLPSSMQRPSIDLSAIDDLSAQNEALVAQSAELAAQSQAQVVRLDALESVSDEAILSAIAALEADLETVVARLAEIEARPVALEAPEIDAASTEEVAALEAELEDQKAQISDLAALESTLAEQKALIADLAARAENAEVRAASEASQILARAALTRVVTAVDSGQSFAPALTDLEAVTPVEVPTALREAAENGVPSMAALQDSFPDAARAGLAAARSEVPESEVVGITGFLKRQLNARSVTPREGSDPDAVLSRAQAAVRAGDLGTALGEMDALPEAARTAMNDWLEAASARKAAQDAAQELADSLNSN